MIIKVTGLEVNHNPSLTTFDDPSKGVQSQLTPVNPNPPQFNGAKIQDMQHSVLFDKLDPLDKIGAAQKQLEQRMDVHKKSAFHTAFIQSIQKLK